MAKPKTHYWKKSDPRNPVPLERGGYLELEIVDQGTGIVLVAAVLVMANQFVVMVLVMVMKII